MHVIIDMYFIYISNFQNTTAISFKTYTYQNCFACFKIELRYLKYAKLVLYTHGPPHKIIAKCMHWQIWKNDKKTTKSESVL